MSLQQQHRFNFIKLFLTLIIGIIIGFTFSQFLHNTDCLFNLQIPLKNVLHISHPGSEYVESPTFNFIEEEIPFADIAQRLNITSSSWQPAKDATTSAVTFPPFSNDTDTTLADYLFNNTRVLCWILTGPNNHATRAINVKNTWGSRCNKLIFMSSEADEELGAIKLSVEEGRKNLWAKTREAWKYIYENHIDDADWFIKADDDTYVIMENLRYFLYQYDTEAPVYFGCKFKIYVRQGYMSGGAGYVLSKEALRRFAELAYPNAKVCRSAKTGYNEDKELGYCLQNVGVAAGDSRDEYQRGRFFPSTPEGHLIPKRHGHWYWHFIFYATKDGLTCCSEYAISFHYVQPKYFYLYDYFIYHLRVFGIEHKIEKLPMKKNTTDLVEKWRTEKPDNLN